MTDIDAMLAGRQEKFVRPNQWDQRILDLLLRRAKAGSEDVARIEFSPFDAPLYDWKCPSDPPTYGLLIVTLKGGREVYKYATEDYR